VVGVNTAIESTSDSNAGIGYAIPSAVINMVAIGLISTGKVEHTYLGINPSEMTPDLASAMNLPANTRGILILAASTTGPAGKAGIKGSTKDVTIDGVSTKVGGDIITSIDGQPLKTYNELVSYLLLSTKTGQVVSLGIIRDGKDTTVKVTLEARPASS
jgi:2-alkenal reductase